MRMLKHLMLLVLLTGPLLLLAQNKNLLVTLSVKNQSLKEVFRSIQSQTGLNIMVTEKILSEAKKVSLKVKDMPLDQVLEQCFRNTGLDYEIVEGTIVVKKKTEKTGVVIAQEIVFSDLIVQGGVLNKSGTPLAGATVSVKGKNRSSVTDERGAYAIAADKDDELIFSYVNFKSSYIKVLGREHIDAVLELKDNSMDVVTISTGYQRIEQKYLTGSVTSHKMDSIMQPGLTTVDKMLEGRVPGMIYMQNSGQPGAAPKLRVRGTSTFLGSQEPLWVVDGIVQVDPVPIPASKVNDLDFVNLVGNAISGINPNDIDQIDVLKDAAATALYGVRAANGVIVVTTKRGKPGPPSVNYTGSLTYTRRPRYTDKDVNMMNSQERVEVSREIIDKQLPFFGPPLGYEKAVLDYHNGLIDYDTYMERIKQAETNNTDWLDLVTQDVLSSNHTLGISGGNQQSRYYASLGYTNETGVIRSEFSKRYTARLGFDVNYKNLKAQFSINANKNDRQYKPQELAILDYAYGTSRAIPVNDENGNPYFYPTRLDNFIYSPGLSRPSLNILNEMKRSGQTVNGSSYTASANLNYQLVQGLQLTAVLSYTSGQTEQKTWFEEKTNYVDKLRGEYAGNPVYDGIPFGGQLQRQTSRQYNYTVRAQVDFSRYLDARNKHQMNASLGTEAVSQKSSTVAQTNRGYYPERGLSFGEINLREYVAYADWLKKEGRSQIGEGLTNLMSGYMTTTYIFDDKYIIGASARSDFSNAFGSRSNEKFLPTWSLSGRWNMHRDLFAHTKWMNLAALRLSYGTQGNMLPNQTPYTIIQKGSFNSNYQGFQSTISSYPNPNVRWEKTKSYNLGFDFALFNNKISGSIGFFYKKTSDAFLTKQVSQVNGTGTYIVNGGILENKGFELSFNFIPINNIGLNGSRKGFIWRIDPQLGQVFNKLLNSSLDNNRTVLVDVRSITYQNYLNGSIPVNGKAINTFYSYRFKGLDNNGKPVFYGLEPENAEALLTNFKKMTRDEIYRSIFVESGRREPIMQGGVSNYFGYRNWTLNFTFTYSFGNKIRLMRIASGNYGTFLPTSSQNLRKEFVNRWRYPGDELATNIPGLSNASEVPWWSASGRYNGPPIALTGYQMYDDSDLRVVKGDYVKLQSFELAYNFDAAFCTKLHVKFFRLSLAGSNLFTIASKELNGQDPTQSGISPSINLTLRPVYTFNINVSF